MKKIFRGIALFFCIVYALCSCRVQHIENSATTEAEMEDVTESSRLSGLAETSASESDAESVIGFISASTSDTESAPIPSPKPTPAALPVSAVYMIEYGELMSATIKLPGTEDYEKYLEEEVKELAENKRYAEKRKL